MFQSGFRKSQIAAMALSLAFVGVAWTGDADAKIKAIPSIFGTKELKAHSLKKFKKSTNAIARNAKETPNDLKVCTPTKKGTLATPRDGAFFSIS